jgi:predicted O-methyltransferase YrrM
VSERSGAIETLMSARESDALDKWASGFAGGLACEIGCYHGYSTRVIAQHCRVWAIDLGGDIFHGTKNVEIIGTDIHTSFMHNMQEAALLPERVIPICGTSCILNDLPLPIFDFILVDADHSYEWCGLDMTNAARVLKPDGVMAIHDYLPGRVTDKDYGVTDAVDHWLLWNPFWNRTELTESLLFISRKDYSGWDPITP